jgi:hypothetical protein
MKFEHVQTKGGGGLEGGSFLKIEEGKSVNGVFRGELKKFWQSWPLGGTKQVFDEPTPGSSIRFRANVVVNEGGKFIAKVWEFGAPVNNMLFEYSQEMEITKVKCKITRTGSGKKTQYIVIPLGPLDAKALKAIEAVELLPLEPKEFTKEEADAANKGDSDEVPF